MSRYFAHITEEELKTKILENFQKRFPAEYKQAEDDVLDEDGEPVTDSDGNPIIEEPDYLGSIQYCWIDFTDKIKKDLSKVEFDFENCWEMEPEICGFKTLENGFTYYGLMAYGDWEDEVFFIVYWDGKTLRAYIPKEGNLYNTDTRTAYGNSGEYDDVNKLKRFGMVGKIDPDLEAIIQDISERIHPK